MSPADKHDKTKIVSIKANDEARTRLLQTRLPKLLNILRARSRAKFEALLVNCFGQVDDTLFNLANNAQKQEDQDHFFSAMRELRVNKNKIIAAYLVAFDNGFLGLSGDGAPKTSQQKLLELNASELTLLAHEDLDELVAKESMVQRALSQNKMLIKHLALRVGEIMRVHVEEVDFVLSPSSLCQMFLDAVSTVEISSKSRIVLLKLFEKHVLLELSNLYKAMNAFLIERGVLPQIATSSTSPPKPFKHEPASHGGGVDSPIDPELLALTQQNSSAGVNSNRPTGADSLGFANKGQNADARVQAGTQGIGYMPPMEPSIMIGGLQYRGHEASELSQQVVHQLMGYSHFPAAFQGLFHRIKKPLQKVLLADQNVWVDPNHKLRQLLNSLSSVVQRYGETDDVNADTDPVYLKLAEITQRLNDGVDNLDEVLPSLVSEVECFIQQEDRRVKLFEKRLLAAEEGKLKTSKSRQLVANAIKEAQQGMVVLGSIQNIIDKAWLNVMLLTVLKHGVDSQAWDKFLQTLIDLITCTQPYFNEAEKLSAAKNICAIEQNLSRGFDELSIDAFTQKQLLQDLNADFEKLQNEPIQNAPSRSGLKQSPEANSDSTNRRKQPVKHNVAEITKKAKHQHPVDEIVLPSLKPKAQVEISPIFMDQAKVLARGNWFDVHLSEGLASRCRLAAIIGNAEKFIFVNRSGAKVADLNLKEVALALQQQKLKPLNSNQMFDRALEEVIVSLRKAQ